MICYTILFRNEVILIIYFGTSVLDFSFPDMFCYCRYTGPQNLGSENHGSNVVDMFVQYCYVSVVSL